MSPNLIIFLMSAAVVRLLLASLFPLTGDESYYWLWSKHLSLSYVDHPPMVAFLNFLTTQGREDIFMLRLGAMLISIAVSLLLYFLAKEIFGEKVAFWSAVLFQIIPHFVVVWLTMFVEHPLVLFWTAALWLLYRIVHERKESLWYWLAVIIGLGYLSKYTMFLFWPCLLLFFLIAPENRFWLKKKEPYLAFILSGLFFLPVLFWNSRHQWVSFAYHGSRAISDPWGVNTLAFIGDQLVHFTPFLLFPLYGISKYALKKDAGTKLLFSFSVPVLTVFLLLSLKVKIWAHWPSVGYIALLPLAVAYLVDNHKDLKKFISWIALFSTLVLAILFWATPAILLRQKEYALNYRLNERLPSGIKIFSRTYVSSSLLEFYLKRQTYLATGFLRIGHPWGEKQFELWGIPNLQKGESILYYGEDLPEFKAKAAENFSRVSILPQARLYLTEDYINNNYKFFKLEGYKGGAAHP
jgi:4-amino-4-deoxy-L-arabinose transferase-like glycosyltransferase